jgi:hypothetical protein
VFDHVRSVTERGAGPIESPGESWIVAVTAVVEMLQRTPSGNRFVEVEEQGFLWCCGCIGLLRRECDDHYGGIFSLLASTCAWCW